ncbi:MAG: acetyl-CoA carboxylase biotin carboxyl carrier protein [Trueperaceae bacterium]
MQLKDLKRLMDAMAAADVADLEYEWDGTEDTPGGRVALRRGAVSAVAPVAPVALAAASSVPPSPPAAVEPEPTPAPAPASTAPKGVEVVAPIVGTFYASPSPEAGPFVKMGDRVKMGQVLCIIEAMKLMNEIESEIAGTVVEVAVRNEDPVEYGQVLFRIDPA